MARPVALVPRRSPSGPGFRRLVPWHPFAHAPLEQLLPERPVTPAPREIPACGCATPGAAEAMLCYCGVEDLLGILRRRYSLAVMGAIHRNQPARYRDIAASVSAASSSTLSETLRALETVQLVRRDAGADGHPVAAYSLTPSGTKLFGRLRRLLEDVQEP